MSCIKDNWTRQLVIIKYFFLLLLVILWVWCFFVQALDISDSRVTDQAWVLTDQEEALLESNIQSIVNNTSAEIAVVIVDSLWWRDPFDVSLDFARYLTDDQEVIDQREEIEWVWSKDYNNWVVVLVAPNDRKRYIQIWYWLEWAIPDALAKRMWEQILVPAFREEQYGEWLEELVQELALVIEWESTNRNIESLDEPAPLFEVFVMLTIVIFFFWPFIKPFLKTDKEKYIWSWTGWWVLGILSSFIVWLSWLWLIIPLIIIFLIIFFGEPWKGSIGGRSWWGYSSWWSSSSFGWWFSGFSWWSFGWWWAWWSW